MPPLPVGGSVPGGMVEGQAQDHRLPGLVTTPRPRYPVLFRRFLGQAQEKAVRGSQAIHPMPFPPATALEAICPELAPCSFPPHPCRHIPKASTSK